MSTPIHATSGAAKRFCSSASPSAQSNPNMEDVMRQLNDSVAVPVCVKVAINMLVEELSMVKKETDKLYEENIYLRWKIGMSPDTPLSSDFDASIAPVAVSQNSSAMKCDGSSYQETERRRPILISGIMDIDSPAVADRVRYDYLSVRNVLVHLDVDCAPVYDSLRERSTVEVAFTAFEATTC
ncbi:hypothetical protein Q1695_006409 [Nippostrongylus brasiliensis]|nr:hypothetical protein Q1695_006409 [Nippostrongylus brasiliensis]